AAQSKAINALPLGLAHNLKVTRAVKAGQHLSWDDVAADTSLAAYQLRTEMMSAL
ncbi:MAG: flagellar biosynthesis protein FlgA, partial [Burkholderiaceae bacterium]|nr:flagellar biosynthesis protein FlgA [Burkholderiaceae bacterium]